MKNRTKEILLFIVLVIFAGASIFCYSKSKTVVSTAEIGYQEKGNIGYKVFLTDKKFYNKDYLDEGMKYISSIIDYIEVKYNYSVVFDQKNNYNVDKKVLADVKIVDSDNSDKIIYSKQDIIKTEKVNTDSIDLSDTIIIDYKKYNSLTNEFKTNYAISADCNLVVSYYVYYENEYGDIKQNRIMTVNVPLSQQMITITKSEPINNNSTYVGSTTKSTVNNLLLIVSLILGVATLILAAAFATQVRKRISSESKYERYIRKLLRDYDSYITESKENAYAANKPIIKVNSFKELLDVRNNIEKAIIYIKENDDISKFIIIDDEVYEYTVTREEMDK